MSGLAVVAVLYSPGECAVVLSRLRAAGIAAVADSWYTGTVAWHWTVALGGMRILVPVPELEAASSLLAERSEDLLPRPAYSRHWVLNAVVAVLILLLSGFPPPARIRGSYHPPAAGAGAAMDGRPKPHPH